MTKNTKIPSLSINKTQTRLYAASSDPTFEHATLDAMRTYVNNDPTAYLGQILYCKANDTMYRIANQNGQKVLTETGIKGPKGDNGERGPKGDKGDAGEVPNMSEYDNRLNKLDQEMENSVTFNLVTEDAGITPPSFNVADLDEKIDRLSEQLETDVDRVNNRIDVLVVNPGDGTKDPEVIDGRGGQASIDARFRGIESGTLIQEVTFDKLKTNSTNILTYPIAALNTWTKWADVSNNTEKITTSGTGIQVAIDSNLSSGNIVVSQSNVNLQSKPLTLRFNMIVNELVSDNDKFNVVLDNKIVLKMVQLKDFTGGKTHTISIDFNDEKIAQGKLSLVFHNSCKCTLDGIMLMDRTISSSNYPFDTFKELIEQIKNGSLINELPFDKLKSTSNDYTNFNEFVEKIENGSLIKEITFDKVKGNATSITTYPIANFNQWSKWSATSGDTNKISSLSNGIKVAIANALSGNLVVSKDNIDLQGKKLTLSFDITVNSIVGSDDKFNLALNNTVALKVIQLKDYTIGKKTTISIDFNNEKVSSGKLSLVFSKPCNCTLENLKLQEYSVSGGNGYSSLKEVVNDVQSLKEDVATLKNGNHSTTTTSTVKDFVLPSVIPAIKELETNIFWDNVLLNTNVKSVERIDVANSIGGRNNVMEDRWRIMLPSNTSSITQTFNVYFNDTTNISKAVKANIQVLDKSLGAGKTKKIIFIGDSLTDNNVYEPELIRMFGNDAMKIELLGSRGEAPNKHEGRSGWTTKHYCTESRFNNRDNAFLNPSTRKFDFTYYMQQQSYNTVDYVFINMGTNDLANDNTATLGYFKEMVKSIKAFNSNIVVFIGLCPPLSSKSDNYKFKNKRIELMKLLLKEFDNRQSERILINPIILNIDAVNGFPTQAISGTRHANENLKVVTDNTHPLTSEYLKMADTIYCSIKYAVSLGY